MNTNTVTVIDTQSSAMWTWVDLEVDPHFDVDLPWDYQNLDNALHPWGGLRAADWFREDATHIMARFENHGPE